MKKIRHYLEYFLFLYFLTICRIMPYGLASLFLGNLVRNIGFFFKADRVAKKNLKKIFPNLTKREISDITLDVWENMGRNFAEFAHFSKMSKEQLFSKVNIEGKEILEKISKEKKPYLFFTAHFSNWELCSLICASSDIDMNIIYRPANNPYVDKKINELRKGNNTASFYRKGLEDARPFVKAIRSGGCGGLLIDQKLSEGEKIKFLGYDAYSSLFIATIAKKYQVPLVPIHVERSKGGNFDVIVQKPITYEEIKDLSDKEIMLKLNQIMEEWIKNKPAEWFWLHNRW